MNEEELIILAKTDNDALEKLLELYEPMIHSLVKGYHIEGYAYEDLLQEARYAFCKAVQKYDATKGKLSTYAYTFIKRRLNDLKKTASVLKRRGEVLSLDAGDDETQYDIPSPRPNPEELLLLEEERKEWGETLREELTDFEFKVAILFAKGYSYADIAKIMNITTKQVSNALERARRKLAKRKNN